MANIYDKNSFEVKFNEKDSLRTDLNNKINQQNNDQLNTIEIIRKSIFNQLNKDKQESLTKIDTLRNEMGFFKQEIKENLNLIKNDKNKELSPIRRDSFLDQD